ncbi:hypothetical protein LSAT2_023567, partial [Lamellibrachia satsuma]
QNAHLGSLRRSRRLAYSRLSPAWSEPPQLSSVAYEAIAPVPRYAILAGTIASRFHLGGILKHYIKTNPTNTGLNFIALIQLGKFPRTNCTYNNLRKAHC